MLQALTYRYDDVSNIIAIEDGRSLYDLAAIADDLSLSSNQAGEFIETAQFEYDDYYRLIYAGNTTTFGEINYRYDNIGNLLARTGELTSSSNASYQQLSLHHFFYGTDGDPASGKPNALTRVDDTVLAYDLSGNLRINDKHQLYWDAKHRLDYSQPIDVSEAGNRTQYIYDENNTRRLKYNVDNETNAISSLTLYISDDSDWRNNQLYKYILVGGQRLALSTQADGQAFTADQFYLVHHNASNAVTVDRDGEIIDAVAYYPYGETRIQVSSQGGSVPEIPYRYAGKERDSETGLYYFDQRYVDSNFARFVTPDPIYSLTERLVNPQHFNPYAYAGSNPYRYRDDSGEFLNFAVKFAADVALNAALNYVTTGEVNLTGALAESAMGVFNPTKSLKTAAKLVKALDKANDSRKATRAAKLAPPCGLSCFAAGTQVLSANGYIAIEDIHVGDLLWSHDPDTGETGLKQVVRTFVNDKDSIWRLAVVTTNGLTETFQVTGTHPYFVSGVGWTRVENLNIGDTLIDSEHNPVWIVSLYDTGRVTTTYNMEVADIHTYYVGTSRVLVHNHDCNPLDVTKSGVKFGQGSVKNTFAHGPFKGRTIGDVADGLRSGKISPDSLPVEFIVRNGERVALNNRSMTALRRAGMEPTKLINRTGSKTHERLLDSHLRGGQPSDVIRIRGAGPGASSIE
ncbi:polymorphic toxin-type HINT domain-containing protein [Teredinibacter turnerae]|uniref:polymorphic toxin-type HINT domain-containing protein n=1 Tax=Teredinibacter turnerae TaxID=2426 RepID=UPI0012FAF90C|nr:polymorphic toxin-type HINT domain-containing protein [Teredinibacter turnerae]